MEEPNNVMSNSVDVFKKAESTNQKSLLKKGLIALGIVASFLGIFGIYKLSTNGNEPRSNDKTLDAKAGNIGDEILPLEDKANPLEQELHGEDQTLGSGKPPSPKTPAQSTTNNIQSLSNNPNPSQITTMPPPKTATDFTQVTPPSDTVKTQNPSLPQGGKPSNPPTENKTCKDADDAFLIFYTNFVSSGSKDKVALETAYQAAKTACAAETGKKLNVDYNKDLKSLVQEYYNTNWSIAVQLNVEEMQSSGIAKSLADALQAVRTIGDYQGTKTVNDLLCDHFFSEFEKEWKARKNGATAIEMWGKAKASCAPGSHAELGKASMTEFVSEIIDQKLSALGTAPDRGVALNEIMVLITYLRSFDNMTKYESVKDKSSLEALIPASAPSSFIKAYPTLKSALNACEAKFAAKKLLDPADLKAMTDALTTLLPTVDSAVPAGEMDQIQKAAFHAVQKAKTAGVTAEQFMFNYYNGLFIDNMLSNAFDEEKSKEVFGRMLASSKALTEAEYGKVTKAEDTDDFKLAQWVQKAFRGSSSIDPVTEKDPFMKLLETGNFRVFSFSEAQRDMIIQIVCTLDTHLGIRLFNNLSKNDSGALKIDALVEPLFKAFSEYALARKKFITKEFTVGKEAVDEHFALDALYKKAVFLDPEFDKVYKRNFPPVAQVGKVPLICGIPDSEFTKALGEYLNTTSIDVSLDLRAIMAFQNCVTACAPYKKFTRTGIDGQQVPFNQFYTGDYEAFKVKLLKYAADEIRKLLPIDRNDNAKYNFPLGSLAKLKSTILAMV